MVYEKVLRLDANAASAAQDVLMYYKKRQPVVLSGALSSNMIKSSIWELENIKQIILECNKLVDAQYHANDIQITVSVRDKTYTPTFYRSMKLPSLEAYFKHIQSCRARGVPQTASMLNGISVPISALTSHADDSPVDDDLPETNDNVYHRLVPKLLTRLHNDNSSHLFRLRDLMGREFARLFISSFGIHSRCHYDRLGLPFFTAQIRGKKTWYLYHPSSLPLDRHEGFDNALAIDFADENVRNDYNGMIAELEIGDMLFIPPFYYHSVRHDGDYNLNIDFVCCPDSVWADALLETAVAIEDVIGLLGSRVFLCYGVPASLLPFGSTLMKTRLFLLIKSFDRQDLLLTMEALFKNQGKVHSDSHQEYLSKSLMACDASAKSNDTASQLLEACVACDHLFQDRCTVMHALSRLLIHVRGDNQAMTSLIDGLKLVRRIVDEMKQRDELIYNVNLTKGDMRMYSDPELTKLFFILYGQEVFD